MAKYSYDVIEDKLERGDYQTKISYPETSNPHIILKTPTTVDEVDAYAEKLKKNLNWKNEHALLMKKYNADISRLNSVFLEDLMDTFFPEVKKDEDKAKYNKILNYVCENANTKLAKLEAISELSEIFG